MEIKQVMNYNVRKCKKFCIFEKGEQYTCYIEPLNYASNFVVTGNGNEIGENITETSLGQKILLACLRLY